MNNKYTLPDLACLLAKRSGKDKKTTELFLRELLATVTDGLSEDQIVKIDGLGTFKIILVEKRESIHVHTGKRFVIPQHYKYTFLADKSLKDAVNRPFSFFETTEINDHVSFADLEETEEYDFCEDEESAEEDLTEMAIGQPGSAPDQITPIADAPPSDIANETINPHKQPPLVVTPVPEDSPQDKARPCPFYKRESFMATCILIFFIIASGVVYNIYSHRKMTPVRSMPKPMVKEAPKDTFKQENLLTDTTYVQLQNPPEIVAIDSASSTAEPVPERIDLVTIERGSTLTRMAQHYYGHKIFWVYIFEANKDLIDDPNNVPIGTVIQIPSPERYQIDATDAESRQQAATLQTEILASLEKQQKSN